MNMVRNIALSLLTASAAVIAGNAVAAETRAFVPMGCATSATVSFYGITGQSWDYYDYNGNGLGASGKANICHMGWGVQVDAFGEAFNGYNDYNNANVGGVAHMYQRNSQFAYGFLLGLETMPDGYEDYHPGFLGVFGGDFHFYMNQQFTVAAQFAGLSVFGQDPDSYAPTRGFVGSVEGRFFLNPSTRIDAFVGFEQNWDQNNEYLAQGPFFGVGFEQQMFGSPITIFGNARWHSNNIDTDDLPTFSARLGVSVLVGQQNLWSKDRSGPSFGTPMFDTVTNAANVYYR